MGLLSSGELGGWETGTQGLHAGVFFLVSGKTVADKSSMLLLALQGSSGQLAGGCDGGCVSGDDGADGPDSGNLLVGMQPEFARTE